MKTLKTMKNLANALSQLDRRHFISRAAKTFLGVIFVKYSIAIRDHAEKDLSMSYARRGRDILLASLGELHKDTAWSNGVVAQLESRSTDQS